MLPNENKFTDVYECKYQEIVDKANVEKLEPQIVIDRKNTGRSFLCAVGASFRTDFLTAEDTLNPVFYFSELDDHRSKMFTRELTKAREEVNRQTQIRKAQQEADNAKKNVKAGTK